MPRNTLEKVWYESKKFIAFLLMEVALGALMFYTVYRNLEIGWPVTTVLIALIFNMGFIAVAFNAKQAELDRYIRLASLVGSASGRLKESSEEPR